MTAHNSRLTCLLELPTIARLLNHLRPIPDLCPRTEVVNTEALPTECSKNTLLWARDRLEMGHFTVACTSSTPAFKEIEQHKYMLFVCISACLSVHQFSDKDQPLLYFVLIQHMQPLHARGAQMPEQWFRTLFSASLNPSMGDKLIISAGPRAGYDSREL